MRRSGRTPLLAFLAAALLAANAWWFWPRGDDIDAPAFQLADAPRGSSEPSEIGKVQLPAQASAEDVRKALLGLVRQGICTVTLPEGPSRKRIHRIVAVRNNSGENEVCRERSAA